MSRNGEKNIILMIIDSFHTQALETCLQANRTPALKYLIEQGQYYPHCVSVFPTMTPTATSAIATGAYADIHQVPGFIWYNRDEHRIINYGVSASAIWKLTPRYVLQDFLFNLNKRHLRKKAKTIFEILEQKGISTASINFFIYRGDRKYKTRVPWWIKVLTGFKLKEHLRGPGTFVLGYVSRPVKMLLTPKIWELFRYWHRFGVNDFFSAKAAQWLIRKGKQSRCTFLYFPDTDGYAHRHTPLGTSEILVKVDKKIQNILNSFGSWEEALQKNVIFVSGDHSQSLVGKSPEDLINLPKILGAYSQLAMKKTPPNEEELVLCPNERMAFIYFLKDKERLHREIREILVKDARLAQICWQIEPGLYRVAQGGTGEILTFSRGGPYKDLYGHQWYFNGNLGTVDGTLKGDVLHFDDYPDAFTRIASLLDAQHCGDLVLSARLGCEFEGEAAPTHAGRGSHGSLHKEDSLVPLIVAGTKKKLVNPRIVDFVPFILRHFGLSLPEYMRKA